MSKKTSPPPVNRKALRLLDEGLVFLDSKDFIKAEHKFKIAIDLEPEFAVAYFYLGNVFFEQELIVEAITAFEKALAIDPHNDELTELVNDIKSLASFA